MSWGDGCGLPEQYGVYTEVPAFIAWVQQRINGVSIIGNNKIGFLGQNRTKPETISFVNATSEQVDVSQYLVRPNNETNFEVDQNNWLFQQGLPAKSQCTFAINALGNNVGEQFAQLTVPLKNETLIHRLNSKVLKPLTVPGANLPWPMFSGGGQETVLNSISSQSWYGINSGDREVVLQSGQVGANEKSVLLTYLNGPAAGDEMYLRFDAKVDAALPDGLYPFVNERMAFPVSLQSGPAHRLHQAGALNDWYSYQILLDEGVNHIMFMYLKDAENDKGSDRALFKNPRICMAADQQDNQCSTAEGFYANQRLKTLDDYSAQTVLDDICTKIDWPLFETDKTAKATTSDVGDSKSSASGGVQFTFILMLIMCLIRGDFLKYIGFSCGKIKRNNYA